MAHDGSSISSEQSNPGSYLTIESRSNFHSFPSQASGITDARPITPLDTIVPEGTWWRSLWSNISTAFDDVCQLWPGPWCTIFGGKLEAFCSCLCLPCRVLHRWLGGSRDHSGIVYLYILLSCSVVLSLVEQTVKEDPRAHVIERKARQYFVIVAMIAAIVGMLYLWLFTRTSVQFDSRHSILKRVFYRAGLYIFGFPSLGYSVCLSINNYSDCKLRATVQMIKAIYIASQTLFLNKFHEAKFSGETRFVQIVLAHLLGTNLALWFWTLSTEAFGEESDESTSTESENCSSNVMTYPIKLDISEKYFYPLFVEYLLIAAGMLYHVWKKNTLSLNARDSRNQNYCYSCMYRMESYNNVERAMQEHGEGDDHSNRAGSSAGLGRQRNRIPSWGIGIVLGLCFAIIFVVMVLLSTDSGVSHHIYYNTYLGASYVLYLSQIVASFIALACLQSQRRNRNRHGLDHDDALLYLSLAGIILFEGFLSYSLLLKKQANNSDWMLDLLGVVEHLVQTVALINLRRYRSTRDRNSKWIRECVLFLLTTNLGLWVQDSFFIDSVVERPGENRKNLQDELKPIGSVLRPMIVFFRFHSATCFFLSWSIFRATI